MMPTALDRWWSKVSREDADGCWPWTAAQDGYGYGAFKVDGKVVKAHRWGFEQMVRPLGLGELVCHSCDNRACCRPAHWFAGSHADNSADMRAKGRSRHWISIEDAEAIRAARAAGERTKDLAARYGVDRTTIWNIQTGRYRT